MYIEKDLKNLLQRTAGSVELEYAWKEKNSLVALYKITFHGRSGAVIYHHNPPVHSVGTPTLDAFTNALGSVRRISGKPEFLLFWSASDPVHAGGDLKETLENLKYTVKKKSELLASGDRSEKDRIDHLYAWADKRLNKAFKLYRKVRSLNKKMRTIAICGGGIRYGGSAEIPLWADTIIGDSRSAICFSEALIGLIPGWGGIGRMISKAGYLNARTLAETARTVSAYDLKRIGIYDTVVDINFPFPEHHRQRTDAPDHQSALWEHHAKTSLELLPVAFAGIFDTKTGKDPKPSLITPDRLRTEIHVRSNWNNYQYLCGEKLSVVGKTYSSFLRPLSANSLKSLETLFSTYHPASFAEESFVEKEMELDAELYRTDEDLILGIEAALEGVVPNFGDLKDTKRTDDHENTY